MSEYKMSECFDLPVRALLRMTGDKSNSLTPDLIRIDKHDALIGIHAKSIAHAINNHDRLAAQVEELKAFVERVAKADVETFNFETQDGDADCFEYTDISIIEEANELLTRIGEDNKPTPQGE